MWQRISDWLYAHFSPSQREKRAIVSYYQCLYRWMNDQRNVRKCSGENRWEVRISDFTDVYLFFGKLAMVVNSQVEIYKRNPVIRYHCSFPRTSVTLQLNECPKYEKRVAIIQNEDIKICFIRINKNSNNN